MIRTAATILVLPGGGYAHLTLTDPQDLTTTGVEITARPPGKKAQALAMLSSRSVPIDLILLDRSMPGMSGECVLTRLSEIAPEVPVVLCSGQPFEATAMTHAAAALLKPISRNELLRTLRHLLHREAS